MRRVLPISSPPIEPAIQLCTGQDAVALQLTFQNVLFLAEYKLFVCSECHEATTSGQLSTHLRKVHQREKKYRDEVESWVRSLTGQYGLAEEPDPQRVPVPNDTIDPIGALGPVQTGGYRCAFTPGNCPFVGATERRIREHLIHSHGWKPPRSRAGRPRLGGMQNAIADINNNNKKNTPVGPWRTGVYYQRFSRRGVHSTWFEVARGRSLDLKPKKDPNSYDSTTLMPPCSANGAREPSVCLPDPSIVSPDIQYRLEGIRSWCDRLNSTWCLSTDAVTGHHAN
ncbi:hypothetical protein BX600DRAFT_266236 [Xylariales sp. PMI_506]|nr:hypothetical protein BX600DRAFT_266236 [Xylariales sp. PMI_506]